jgi:hypothetical protein
MARAAVTPIAVADERRVRVGDAAVPNAAFVWAMSDEAATRTGPLASGALSWAV